MYQIRIIPEDQLEVTIPLLRELNPHISEDLLRSRQKEMIGHNYHCAGIYDGEKLIGISGIWILIKYYVGKHVELDNVYLKKGISGPGPRKSIGRMDS
ncbi:hypothetical protein [Euzebyella saccharophila]|uniref:Uncharacterized protein n=1 Tax=Euzebyella saccharophila TaxID=679664 RepID=A0ABV8JVL5_9FLAO|nr:hypothetical protein [Euzebyella saccharophila]